MPFTSADVLDRAKRRLNLVGNTDFDTEFYQWMDDVQGILDLELVQNGQSWKASPVDIATVVNTDSYAIPNPVYYIQSVHYLKGGVYYKLIFNPSIVGDDYDATTKSTSGVVYWALKGNNIVIDGAPDTAVAAGLRLVVYPDASDVDSDTSISETKIVRTIFTYYLVWCYNDRFDSADADKKLRNFEILLMKYVNASARRYTGQQTTQIL